MLGDIAPVSDEPNSEGYYTLVYENKKLKDYLRYMTSDKTRVPWEHLVTRREREAFLRGFLDVRGRFSLDTGGRSRVRFGRRLERKKKEGETDEDKIEESLKIKGLMDEIQILMGRVDIFPAESYDEIKTNLSITIQGVHNLKRLVKIGFLTEEEANLKVASVEEDPLKKYKRVRGDKKKHPSKKVKDIARDAGIGRNTASKWLREGMDGKPIRLKNYMRVTDLEEGLPDPDAIGYLFRKMGLTPEDSRKIAGRYKKSTLEKVVAYIRKQGIDPGGRLDLLELSLPEVKKKLGTTST